MIRFLILLVFSATTAFANWTNLTVDDFSKSDLFQHVWVVEAESVFFDELVGRELYKVTYEVEGDCQAAGDYDACEMVPYCEYIWVEAVTNKNKPYQIEGTEISCEASLEELVGGGLIDEL